VERIGGGTDIPDVPWISVVFGGLGISMVDHGYPCSSTDIHWCEPWISNARARTSVVLSYGY